ncbi:hypothetical protein ACH5RR_039075 [Cinchona calisaya]|uniref:RNase H type-1 domain-containing protein n=1 Tax=Cinchona calisaya TaxID=153742 RepID=A0ABD2Y2D0_9GENT
MAGIAENVYGVVNPEAAELIAARRALEFGAELQLSGFELDGDARNVISALTAQEENLSVMGPLLEDSRLWIEAGQVRNIAWVGRDGNQLADSFA